MMSNVLAFTQQQADRLALLYLLVGPLVSLAIAYFAGVFTPAKLRSPDRLAPGERPGTFVLVFLAGLAVWMLTPAVYAGYRTSAATTRGGVQLGPVEQVVLGAVASLTALVVLLVGNAVYRPNGLARLGLEGRRLWNAIPWGIVGIIAIMPMMAWVGLVTMKLWEGLRLIEQPIKHELLEILDRTSEPWLVGLLVFLAVVIAPVYEEVLFRGHLQSLLRHTFGRPWPAIVVTSLAFAVVHPWWMWPMIFFLSLCLGYAYERRGNLWLAIVLHALFNGISVLVSLNVPPTTQ